MIYKLIKLVNMLDQKRLIAVNSGYCDLVHSIISKYFGYGVVSHEDPESKSGKW